MSGNLKEIFLSTIERYFVGLESITCISDKRTRFVFKLQFMCDEPDEEPDYDTVSIQYMKIIPTSDIPEMEITQILDCTPFLNTEDCFEFGEEPALDFAGFIISDVGDSIRDMITNKMCFTWVEFKILFTTLMLNLCRMHERGYIHMNIHGGNVCIKYRCSHLIDFQYAVKMDEHGKIKNGLISSVYRAPEVCNDGDDLTAAVDVYAAGRMLQDVLSYGLVKGSPDQLTKLSELLSKMTYVEPLERPTALDAYHMFVESENELPGIPSLASLSNAKIIQALNEYPLDNVELLGSLLESRLPDFLPQIRYRPFKVLVENNGIPDWKDGVTVDQYYTYLENSYRELFVENRSSPILDNPYLLLEKIHISISDYLADPLQPDLENNMYFFKPKLEFNQKTICGQEQFKIQWNHFTGGIFQNICLDNLFFAGGAVLAALQPFDSSKDLEEQFTNSGFYNSDIDIFVYGITDPVAATARVAQFCEELLLQTSDEVLFVRSRHTITIIRPHPHRQLQVILRLYKSPAEILIGFDIDSCSVGYDGKDVYGLPRFVRSVITGYNVIDITRRSPSYEYRLYKYSKRGFGVLVPGVSRKNIRFKEVWFSEATGLRRLMALERGMFVGFNKRQYWGEEQCRVSSRGYLSESSDEEDENESDLDTVDSYHEEYKGQQEIIDLDRIEEQEQYSMANYFTLKIPRGPNWPMARIGQYLDNFNQHYSNQRFYGPLQHEEFEIESVWLDPIIFSELVELVLAGDRPIAAIDGFSVTGLTLNDSWIIENPGQQMLTGSFHSIQSEFKDWVNSTGDYEV